MAIWPYPLLFLLFVFKSLLRDCFQTRVISPWSSLSLLLNIVIICEPYCLNKVKYQNTVSMHGTGNRQYSYVHAQCPYNNYYNIWYNILLWYLFHFFLYCHRNIMICFRFKFTSNSLLLFPSLRCFNSKRRAT